MVEGVARGRVHHEMSFLPGRQRPGDRLAGQRGRVRHPPPARVPGLQAALHDLRADRRGHIKVVKKDGSRVPYDRNRLKQGLEKACWKRPISDAKLEADRLRRWKTTWRPTSSRRSQSRYLGELVMRQLRELDQVAYVRFASVYRQFEDVHDFVDELKPMLAESPRARRLNRQDVLLLSGATTNSARLLERLVGRRGRRRGQFFGGLRANQTAFCRA